MFKRAFTHVALVRPFLRVNAPMYAEIFLHRERLVTILALVRFFASMSTIMTRQSRRYRKRLAADVTAIWILALLTVRSQVTLIYILLRKALLTE